MDVDLFEDRAGDILRRSLRESEDGLLAVNPSRETIQELVYTLRDGHERAGRNEGGGGVTPSVRLFVDERPLKRLLEDFLVASIVADLIAEGTLAVRTLESVPRSSLLLADGFVVSLVESDERIAGLTTAEESFVTDLESYYDGLWRDAPSFSLRTPPLSHIRETLGESIGSNAVRDFDRALTTLDSARGNGKELDEVTICLLVAANNDELLYDISRWGEDIGLASKATFSRVKNRLEDHGLIDTEKVPIDVGRPRLRLMLTDDTSAGIEELIEHAQSRLA